MKITLMNLGLAVMMITVMGACATTKPKPIAAPLEPSGPNIISLFSDFKATPKVGDLITVQIIENASGSKKNTSRAGKNTDLTADLKLDTKDSNNDNKLGLKTKNNYDADNRYTKQGSLVANLTAVVVEVTPNGTARIRGSQEITLDSGSQVITLSGLVRPEDISTSNTVQSTRLGEAKITYKSKNEPDIHHRSLIGWLFGLVF